MASSLALSIFHTRKCLNYWGTKKAFFFCLKPQLNLSSWLFFLPSFWYQNDRFMWQHPSFFLQHPSQSFIIVDSLWAVWFLSVSSKYSLFFFYRNLKRLSGCIISYNWNTMESQSPTHRPVGSQPEYSAVGPYFTLFSLRLFEGEIMLWEMLAGHENLS